MTKSQFEMEVDRLRYDGFVVLRGVYDQQTLEAARKLVLDHRGLLRNTRPLASAGHLAGFHRHPVLEPLHTLVSNHPSVHAIVRAASGCEAMHTIGLSDITINRSQQWHVDLLRGPYQPHLSPEICWGPQGGGVYKVLLYLQPGRSLKVLAGAHLTEVPLAYDAQIEPADAASATSVDVCLGDIVVMDVRLPHRGATDDEIGAADHLPPKILISTALGATRWLLTLAMEHGNFERLRDWEMRHGSELV